MKIIYFVIPVDEFDADDSDLMLSSSESEMMVE